MPAAKPTSLSGKLTRLSVLVTATGLLLACAAFVTYDFVSIRRALVRNLSVQAHLLGSSSVAALVFNDRVSAENTLAALRAAPNVVAACVYSAEGKPFAAYRRDPASSVPGRVELPAGDEEKQWFDRGDVMLVGRIVFQGHPTGFIFIESDLQAFWAGMRRYLAISLCVLVGALLVAVGLSTQIRHEILRPIEALADVARALTEDRNYSVRAAGEGAAAEMAILVRAFNDML